MAGRNEARQPIKWLNNILPGLEKKRKQKNLDATIVSLPEEDINEKEIVVNHNPELDNFDESQVVDPVEDEENFVSDEEVEGAAEPDGSYVETPQFADESETETTNEEGGKEETTGEEEENTEGENAEQEPEDKDKEKPEDKDKEEQKSGSYERYPTGLRIGEDLAKAGAYGIDTVKDIASRDIGGTSINTALQQAKNIPHYDYTSLFGRR